ncbi:MAG TPA: Z1 domain-containing protein [Solirubrobacterales bacterium]|jgi:hypothetical protein|nr:Z1 domain-containing protein [Solirubrobacterales bacterium]
MPESPMEIARNLAMVLLAPHEHPTQDDLDQAVASAVAALAPRGETIDPKELRRRLEAEVSIYVGPSVMLRDHDDNHRPWLNARRSEIDWRFWPAYREWSSRRLPPEVIRNLDRLTDEVLDGLEDPRRPGPWDRRGMLVGQVQSGKTGNYTALICKAADAGYNFIVVLAGLHNSLRSQTQRRLDEGFLGLDSRLSLTGNRSRTIGVAAGGRHHPAAQTLTSSDDRGDFATAVASRVAGRIDSDSQPIILVVKKHKTILNNLYEWVTSINGERDPETGRMMVSRFPLLLIDDEADNASVNTKNIEREHSEDGELISETAPSEINRQIRRLLHAFDRSALVSYTATPFANIFIDGEDPSPEFGEDLFPRSFVLRMSPPTNYVGPAEIFGLAAFDAPDGVERPGLPVLRTVTDQDGWVQAKMKSAADVGPLSGSVRRAIRSFLLIAAVRRARGQTDAHNSMLVHVTRYVAVQGRVCEQIQEEVDTLRERIVFGEGAGDPVLDEFRQLWEEDFEPTSREVPAELRGAPVTWGEVRDQLPQAVGSVSVLEVNGSARDALTYADHPGGLTVIAVGGDKLSRGLTLEGLTVSYYLRASKMYDTLMQMGRWFGYRAGYTDLIRLFTTTELRNAYRDITVANEELGEKFDEMARTGSNPKQFALYVRKSPAGLLVTAHSKMRSGREMKVSYSGDISETIAFSRDVAIQENNFTLLDQFLLSQSAAGRLTTDQGNPRWEEIPGEEIAGFLEQFHTVDAAKKARARLLASYVRSRLKAGELGDWTVVLINNRSAEREATVGGLDIGLTMRAHYSASSALTASEPIEGEYTVRRLADPEHELLDLDDTERAEAQRLREEAIRAAAESALAGGKIKEPKLGPFSRKVRPVTRGLLTLYCLNPEPAGLAASVEAIPAFFISFPESEGAPAINYVVPQRYHEQVAG